ncbi:hypothetical protein HN011_011351 [Eciton burchellii]|nr:hypothetical protein HN011_011351 [Eciton burchellii]
MDTLICNKCLAPTHRGKQPYNITQCGHIFCQGCLQQAEKQCPQCQYIGSMSIPLREPLAPKVTPFFVPLNETLEMLLKVDMFRSNQMRITMQRFHELDKKYEMLKNQYWVVQHNLKILTQKYVNLKAEKEKLDKKMLVSQMHKEISQSASNLVLRKPIKSNMFTPSSSTGYSSGSESLRSANVTPVASISSSKRGTTIDGFRVPSSRRPPRSIASFPSSWSLNGRI